jgi:predicted TIM-barrel fold metal-dependent hydrolase
MTQIPDWNALNGRSYYESYADSCLPASFDARERLKWMDACGISKTLLFPSLGLLWPLEAPKEPDYVRAHMAAYNRWLSAFSMYTDGRLVPVAQVALYESQQAIEDLDRLLELGFRHIMFPWRPLGTCSAFDAAFDRFWAACEASNVAIHLHKIAVPTMLGRPVTKLGDDHSTGTFFEHVHQILPAQTSLTSLFEHQLPDRYPDLRWAWHECHAGWLSAWMARADESYATLYKNHRARLTKYPPSEYLRGSGRFFFGASDSEPVDLLRLTPDNVMLATDFPHPGCCLDIANVWSERLRNDRSLLSKLMTGNAQRLLA